jgi:hypothetical protein
VIVVTCDWDCNRGINNPNGVFSGVTVQLVVRTDQEPQHCTVHFHHYNNIVRIISVNTVLVSRWRNCKALRAIIAKTECLSLPAEAGGTGNVININIKTSNESLSRSSEAIPLRQIEDGSRRDSTPDLRRSKRGKTNVILLSAQLRC